MIHESLTIADNEKLNRIKRCRNGHRVAKLKQQRSTLETKLKLLWEQDEVILALLRVEEIETEQADILQEKIESVIIEIGMALTEHDKSSTTESDSNVTTSVVPVLPTTSMTDNNKS